MKTLAPAPCVAYHNGTMSTQLTKKVRAALDGAPCSLRALAREAGVSHVTLVRINGGEREATPVVAKAVADALARWARRCTVLSEGLTRTLRRTKGRKPS